MPPQVNAEPVSPATLPPVKSGVRSSEFIVALAVLVVATGALFSGKLPPLFAVLLLALVSVVYSYVRTTLKQAHLDLYAELLQTAFENAPFNVAPQKAGPVAQTHPPVAPVGVETDPEKIAFGNPSR